jgi:hypothetical protein
MQTGAHLLAVSAFLAECALGADFESQEITCTTCTAYLGYKILRAFEKTETWKESRFLLELAELENPYRPDAIGLDSSDSEDSS